MPENRIHLFYKQRFSGLSKRIVMGIELKHELSQPTPHHILEVVSAKFGELPGGDTETEVEPQKTVIAQERDPSSRKS